MRSAVWIRQLVIVASIVSVVGLSERTAQAEPSDGPFGMGIILGEPTGLTFKFWFNAMHAIDLHVAWDFSDEAIAIFLDYLFHLDLFELNTDRITLPLYVGVGGKLGIDADDGPNDDDDVTLGIRVPIGVAVHFTRVPVECFLEVAPGIRLIDETDFDFDAGIGARFYF